MAKYDRDQQEAYNHALNKIQGDNAGKIQSHSAASVRKATADDIVAGASVRDINGQAIGKIDSLHTDQVLVNTGQTKVGVPLVAFGKDKTGLLIGITAAKFNEMVATAHAQAVASAPPCKARTSSRDRRRYQRRGTITGCEWPTDREDHDRSK